MTAIDRIWVALDVVSVDAASRIVDMLMPLGLMQYKIGLELITRVGPDAAIACVKSRGGRVFYDGKFHDIPNTVEGAVKAVVDKGVDLFNLHALCGCEAIERAIACKGQSKVAAVTLLTSLAEADLLNFGYPPGVSKDVVVRSLADLAALKCGVDAVICSPLEAALVRNVSSAVMIVTPGVRPAGAEAQDQKRISTPGNALKAGATHLVIGRPITEAKDPAEALKRIVAEMDLALSS